MESILGLPEPRHFPISLKRFGLNPFGDPMWRIVFAPSVKRLVGGLWDDGQKTYRVRPVYRDLGDKWVLEKWISAFEDSGMTESTYRLHFTDVASGLLMAGPYPHRGVYHHVHTFEQVLPDDCNLEWLIGIIARAKHNDPVKVKEAIDEHYRKEALERHNKGIDKLKDLRPALGMRPASLPGHVHSTKSFKFKWDADDLRNMPRSGARKGA